ncbi:hypothetical protein COT48_01775 [Candidatus Woesearchaeota archaeon CG08_land_8_20_14_0_20_47_9]|nr:MAG: hypothetical protein AUJ69_00350 [Candidatus Woesearchaeota archaeon CG1_02_47_18]PIO04173.1 MAG: hypothetical protein COT48_01775 [Candidatus Woesearchaeota archaeon CG08_land_8_20_14_0_20_47_9]HII30372.1 sugar phosphate isomerase/epimerase [Candidatus Woesearchaeota archaeon]
MVVFSRGYSNSMDRDYKLPFSADDNELGLPLNDIGISAPPMQEPLQGLKSKIFQGASRVELGFMGRGKGSLQQGATTPELFGKDERQDVRELADFNKVKLSVHATVATGSLAGFGEHGFDEQARETALHEIERAVDFAADTTHGGAVVVHVGEWQRPIMEVAKRFEQGTAQRYGGTLKGYPTEEEHATFYVVQSDTGQVQALRRDMKVWEPIKTGEYAEVPNPEEPNKPTLMPIYERNSDGTLKLNEKTFQQIVGDDRVNPKVETKGKTDEEVFVQHFYKTRITQMHAEALRWTQESGLYKRQKDAAETGIREFHLAYGVDPNRMDPSAEERAKVELSIMGRSDLNDDKKEELIRHYRTLLESHTRANTEIPWMEEAAVAYGKQVKELEYAAKNSVSMEHYGLDKTADTIARAGMMTFDKTRQMEQKGVKVSENLYIAPENLFPETYGSHPDELRKIIVQSREQMKNMLIRSNIAPQKADELSKQYIKATIDVGHAYTWKKYFEAAHPGMSLEARDKAFNRWVVDKVGQLAKDGIIGHVHVSDNFGWEDDHAVPGQGTAPIKEFVEKLKQAGLKDVIVEPSHHDFRAVLGGWKVFGSPIYGLQYAGRPQSWTDIEHSYFGRTAPPYFLYGEAAPRPDEWILWSETRLE